MAADRRVASSGSTSDCKCPPEAVPPTSRHLKKRRVVKYRARKRPEKSRKKGNSSSSCYRLFFFFSFFFLANASGKWPAPAYLTAGPGAALLYIPLVCGPG